MRSLRHSYTILLALLTAALAVVSCGRRGSAAVEKLEQGEANYKAGTSSNYASHYEESVYYLKQAEEAFLDVDPAALSPEMQGKRAKLLGLTWFHLGNTSESEMLYEIAKEYYRKSVPLLRESKNLTYLACAYRDIARTTALTEGEQDSVLYYFAEAERFAKEAQSTVLELDIRAYRYQLCFPDSIPQRLEVCRRLAEEFGAHARYSEIVELLLSEAETDSAAYYLERLQPQDSAYAYWFEQSYTYLQSKILEQEGKSGEAYSLLLDLYDRKIEELRRDAGSRTYAADICVDASL